MAVYLGISDEREINNMSVHYFNQILRVLRKRVSYESHSNLLGRTLFDEKAGKSITEIIESVNPFSNGDGKKGNNNALWGAINTGAVKLPEADNKVADSVGWFKDAISVTSDKKEET